MAHGSERRTCLTGIPISILSPIMKPLAKWVLALTTLASVLNVRAADTLTRREWTVDGAVREALVYAPPQASTNASPVVFVFHGHGGSMQNAARSFALQRVWPAAIVVY